MVPEAKTSVSPGDLLAMQILGPHSRPPESETLGVRPAIYLGDSGAHPQFESRSFKEHQIDGEQ